MTHQNKTTLQALYGVLDQEILTTTITGRRDVLMYQPISEAKIIPEFLPRQLRSVNAAGYSDKPRTIICCPMEEFNLLVSCELLLSIQIRNLHMLSLFSRTRTCPVYALPMAYVVEGGTS